MPIEGDDYTQYTEDDIRSAVESELQTEFGQDIDLTDSSVFSTLAQVLAAVLASNQEQSLKDVYQSAFLDTATGKNLDRVVSIIGIQRRQAIHATGVERFEATGPVTQDYTIQGGTTIQTDGDDPTEFETVGVQTLELFDSFEDGDLNEYSGDTASGSVVTDATAPHGDNVLELDATADAHIYNDSITVEQGTTMHGWANPTAGTIPTLTFAINPDDATDYYQVSVDEGTDEVRLERVDGGTIASTIDTLTGAGLTAGEYHEVEVDWNITDNIGVTVYDKDGNELGTLGGADSTYQRGHVGFKSEDATSTKRFDWYTTSAVSANIRALVGGTVGNVGPNSITRTPSPPAGVDSITNLYPIGDNSYDDLDDVSFVVGKDRETDAQLRERAQETVTGGGDATHDAIASELINNVQNVTSVSIYENKTDTDNTGTGGLPPHSFEVVAFGGTDEAVARAIFEKKAVTARDYAGANGTATTVTVTSDVTGQSRDISFSRVAELAVDMTLDLVIDSTYIGDDALRDRIVQYVGGTQTDGTEVVGLDPAKDVLIDQIRDIVVGDDTGVVGFDSSVDGTPISTTPSITTVDGLEVIDVGANETAQTDATDSSITLNTRTQ